MATIRIAQPARIIVVLGKEEGSVIPLGRVFVKQLIYRPQKPFRLFPGRRALAAQSCLEICHEQSSSDAFARYVGYYQPEPAASEIKKIVIVSPDGPSGMASPVINKGSNLRLALRKQTGLHLLGNCQVVRSLALCLQPGSLGSALSFERARCLIELNDRETVSVHIFKNRVPGLPASPGRLHWRERETDCTSRPFLEQATHVFGKKAKSGILPDALVLPRSFGWNHEGHARQADACRSGEPTRRWGSDNDPPTALRSGQVHDRLEIQFFHEEPPTPLLIPDPEGHKVQAKKGLQECRSEGRSMVPQHSSRMF